MKLVEHRLLEFIELVDSSNPTPGGGSVSALSVLEGVALFRMVAKLTMTKKKFLKLQEQEQKDYMKRNDQLEVIKHHIQDLIDKDTESYNEILEAYRLPKETDVEIKTRNKAIVDATLIATEIPYQVSVLALQAIDIVTPMVPVALKSAMSDLGVGLWMTYAGLKGAIYNVKTNMVGCEDQETKSYYFSRSDAIDKKASDLLEILLPIITAPFETIDA